MIFYLQQEMLNLFIMETISFLGQKVWDISPKNSKDTENIKILKSKVKLWKPENCPCRLNKIYLANVGFI